MIKVNPPTKEEAALLESRAIMSLFWPAQNKELLERMAKQGATVLAMDQLPRTLSRGQVITTYSSLVDVKFCLPWSSICPTRLGSTRLFVAAHFMCRSLECTPDMLQRETSRACVDR